MPSDDPLDPNPFANAFLSEEGDVKAVNIYAAVGVALSHWEDCEVSFGALYSVLIKPAGSNVILMSAFGAINAAGTRREMTLEACDEFFHLHENTELRMEARHLLNLHKTAASRRAEIAHSVVMGHSHFKVVDGVAQPIPVNYFLIPPMFATRKNSREMKLDELFWGKPKYRYGSKDIVNFSRKFQALSTRALKLVQGIRDFYSALPKEKRFS